MASRSETASRHFARRLADVLSFLLILIGVVVMASWVTGNRTLIEIRPGLAPMQFRTALAFTLLGVALCPWVVEKVRWRTAVALGAVALAVLALIQYAGGFHLHYGERLISSLYFDRVIVTGRMSPLTAICFVAAGTGAILLHRGPRRPWLDILVIVLGAAVVMTAATGLLFYAEDDNELADVGLLQLMALHTLAGFTVAGGALMARGSSYLALRELSGPGMRSALITYSASVLGATVFCAGWLVYVPLHNAAAMRTQEQLLSLAGAGANFLAGTVEEQGQLMETLTTMLRQNGSLKRAADPGNNLFPPAPRPNVPGLRSLAVYDAKGENQSLIAHADDLGVIVPLEDGATQVIALNNTPVLVKCHRVAETGQTIVAAFDLSNVLNPLIDRWRLSRSASLVLLLPSPDGDALLDEPSRLRLEPAETQRLIQTLRFSQANAGVLRLVLNNPAESNLIVAFFRTPYPGVEVLAMEEVHMASAGLVHRLLTVFLALLLLVGLGVLGLHLLLRPLADQLLIRHEELEQRIAEATDSLQQELTEHRQAEARLQSEQARLAQTNRDLKQFTYVASQHLQNPIRQVGRFVELLERRSGNRLDDKDRDHLRMIQTGLRQMRELVNDLLNLAKLSQGTVASDAVNLREVADTALENLDAEIGSCGAVVTVEDLPLVRGDRAKLVTLLEGLLSNGIKFVEAGRRPEVRVWSEPSGDGTSHIHVADNGIGVESSDQERIFNTFIRLQAAAGYEGNGIGLAICRKIVERHGGTLTVTSHPGEGSTFSFSLPTIARVTADFQV